MLFRPAVNLLEEIVDDKTPHSGVMGFIVYFSVSTILAPGVLFLLLSNNNKSIIHKITLKMAEKYLDE